MSGYNNKGNTSSPVATTPTIYMGAVAPATTPLKIGDIYIDTVLAKVYIAAGTSASSDWKVLN